MAQSLSTLQSAALAPVLAVTGVNPSVAPATLTFPAGALAADPAGGQTVTITGTGFNEGVAVYINTTQCSTTYGNSNSLTFTTPATSVGLYNIVVYNTDGTNGTKPAGIRFEPFPVWVTSSGALTPATTNSPYSTTVSATGTGITYSVASGSLPTGLSLNSSTGAITGTPTSANTFNFTLAATNTYNQVTTRAFSIDVITQIIFSYLVVAGGGAGGGYYNSGGGGAGGLLSGSNISVSPGASFTCTVGAGATGTQAFVLRGSNSSLSGTGFSTVTAIGGGGGGSYDYTGNVFASGQYVGGSGGQGGSGGGSSGYVITASYFAPGVYPGSAWLSAPRQGYDGNVGGQYGAGGGGGAGGPGSKGGSSVGGNGGIGVQSSITGTATYYAGGGGGAAYSPGPTVVTPGSGGLGGGGSGATYQPGGPYSGNVNTGGGGGGASNYYPGTGTGGSGGSGVVIIRTTATATATTGSPTITTDGANTVYKFTQSGTITF